MIKYKDKPLEIPISFPHSSTNFWISEENAPWDDWQITPAYIGDKMATFSIVAFSCELCKYDDFEIMMALHEYFKYSTYLFIFKVMKLIS